MSYLRISKCLACFLSTKTGLSKDKEIVITYAIEVLIINLLNIMFTLTIGMFFGVLRGTIVCLLTVAIFRHTAGGAHSRSPWRCALITISVFPLLALLSKYLTSYGMIYADILSLTAMITGIITVVLLAPVDSESAPIISGQRRKLLKYLSIIVMVIISIIIFCLRIYSNKPYAIEIINCMSLSTIWVVFILTKYGHRVISFIDDLEIIKKGV